MLIERLIKIRYTELTQVISLIYVEKVLSFLTSPCPSRPRQP